MRLTGPVVIAKSVSEGEHRSDVNMLSSRNLESPHMRLAGPALRGSSVNSCRPVGTHTCLWAHPAAPLVQGRRPAAADPDPEARARRGREGGCCVCV